MTDTLNQTGAISKLKALARQNQQRREDTEDHNPLDVRAGISTTGDVSLLRLEAEMAESDEYTVENPHIPIDQETLQRATEDIESDGHAPAWEQ